MFWIYPDTAPSPIYDARFGYLCTNMDTGTFIDHANGSFAIINGRRFYSPNSRRKVELPGPAVTNIFKVLNVTLATLTEPQWWTPQFGWLCFIPTWRVYEPSPFNRLDQPTFFVKSPTGNGLQLERKITESWLRLEKFLVLVTSSLSKKYKIAPTRPFSPSGYQYHKDFKFVNSIRRRVRLSRDWFIVWMALLSYVIATGEDPHVPGSMELPKWYKILQDDKGLPNWLNGILCSTVCSFSPSTPRVGTFISLGASLSLQPPVEWFCKFNVPVWYPWGAAEEALVQKIPSFNAYTPPAEMFQHEILQGSIPSALSTPLRMGEIMTFIPWQEFLMDRNQRNRDFESHHESLEEKAIRMERQADPPIIRTKVFRWIRGQSNPDDPHLYRTLVNPSDNFTCIANYGERQKYYDAFHNEWDLCTEFDLADNSDQYHQEGEVDTPPVDIDCMVPDIDFSRSQSPIPLADEAGGSFSIIVKDLNRLLFRFGFVPPLIPSSTNTPTDERQWKSCLRALGLSAPETRSLPPFDSAVYSFIRALVEARKPATDVWDFDRNNHLSVLTSSRFNTMTRPFPDLFVFKFPDTPSVSWQLAVMTAHHALFVCRLDSNFDQYQVARRLVEEGVPFRTLALLPALSCEPECFWFPFIPIRREGYVFGPRDFFEYEQNRAVVLRGPRARAALLRGGILWRLTVDILSVDFTLRGPSSECTTNRRGFSRVATRGWEFWDDDLSSQECDIVCGVNKCYTGIIIFTISSL